jgi:hypothetical protein
VGISTLENSKGQNMRADSEAKQNEQRILLELVQQGSTQQFTLEKRGLSLEFITNGAMALTKNTSASSTVLTACGTVSLNQK